MREQLVIDGCTITITGENATELAQRIQSQEHWLGVTSRLAKQLSIDRDRLMQQVAALQQKLHPTQERG